MTVIGKFSHAYRVWLADFLAEGHDSSLDKLDEVLDAFETKRLPRIGPTAGREGFFCTEGSDGTNLDSRIDQIPNTWIH